MPYCVFWDVQHCLLGSGGVAQYHLNQFLLELYKVMPTEQVAKFCNAIQLPAAFPRLPKNFFEVRVVGGSTSHIKAFASEVFTAAELLNILGEMMLRPRGLLLDHLDVLNKLVQLLDVLSLGDALPHRNQELEAAMDNYVDGFLAMYSQRSVPKRHYLSHVPKNVALFGAYLTCFGPERRHHFTKSLAAYFYRDLGKSLSGRSIYHFIQACQRAGHFSIPCLNQGRRVDAQALPMAREMGVVEAFEGRSLTLARGTVTRSDMVMYRLGGEVRVGLVEGCFRLHTGSVIFHACVVRPHRFNAGSRLLSPLAAPIYLKAESVGKALMHLQVGDDVMVSVPFVI